MRRRKELYSTVKHRFTTVLAVFLLLSIYPGAFSQGVSQKVTRQSALEAFEKDDLNSALDQFSELSLLFPRDPLYKYYCGVCLVKLEKDPAHASSLLLEAIKGSAAIRTVPADGFFYLGRAQQMSGKFEEALQSYNSFSLTAGRKTSKEMNVDEFIQQCREGKGSISQTPGTKLQPLTAGQQVKDPPPVNERANVFETDLNKKDLQKPAEQLTIPASYEDLMDQALDMQFKSDSLSRLAGILRKQLEDPDNSSKDAIKARINQLEKEAGEYRKISDSKMAEARKLTAGGQEKKPEAPEVEKVQPAAVSKTEKVITETPSPSIEASKINEIPALQRDVEIFSFFEILKNPEAYPAEKIEINPENPAGLVYRIQVAVFRNPVAVSYFKGMSPVVGFRNASNGLTTYYTGMFRRSSDAESALLKVKPLGFKDSFVGAFMDGKPVSAERARLLEKEWTTIPLQVVKQNPLEPIADTIPPVLVFRIEASKSLKPQPAETLEKYRRLSGSRGLDIVVNESREIVYLIGRFISYQSASEYADLLVRNGLKDAKVVAYLGKREIPVDVARELFEKY